MGFCFGGEQSLSNWASALQTRWTVVLFYGSTVDDGSAQPSSRWPTRSPSSASSERRIRQIPISEVTVLEEALNQAGIENTVTIYDGVGHASHRENHDGPGAG
ncbi:MAG: dienelactone hydrolase family protein [Caldilineaceae bacterium]